MSTLRRMDGHVHFIGAGSNDGCSLQVRTPWERLQARALVASWGFPANAWRGNLSELLAAQLLHFLSTSSLDALVLLAHELPYDDHGQPLPQHARFHVPNQAILDLCARYPDQFVPAVSIHPGRPDALDALEHCIEAGARILKILPCVQNINCNAPAYRPFWERMAEARMILLAHTGGERSLPVLAPAYTHPHILRQPLACGVRCIAAHVAGGSWPADPHDHMQDLLAMFAEFPHLYADNAALCTPNRAYLLRHLLTPEIQARMIHGSDLPIPVGGLGPALWGRLPLKIWMRWARHPNPIERDYQYKRAIGFSEDTFTRLDALLADAPKQPKSEALDHDIGHPHQ